MPCGCQVGNRSASSAVDAANQLAEFDPVDPAGAAAVDDAAAVDGDRAVGGPADAAGAVVGSGSKLFISAAEAVAPFAWAAIGPGMSLLRISVQPADANIDEDDSALPVPISTSIAVARAGLESSLSGPPPDTPPSACSNLLRCSNPFSAPAISAGTFVSLAADLRTGSVPPDAVAFVEGATPVI